MSDRIVAPQRSHTRRSTRRVGIGLAFLAPNIVGFLAFTLVPLFVSLAMAFTNWDLRLHNQFKDEPLQFVGIGNFTRLITAPDFWRFFANTLVLMLGIPVAIAGSLGLALLLNRDLNAGNLSDKRIARRIAIVAAAIVVPVSWFVGGSMLGLISTIAVGMLIAGLYLGSTFYRTVYYIPHFTAGVATILLWKNLLNPQIGPINTALTPLLDTIAAIIRFIPDWLVRSTSWLALFSMLLALLMMLNRWRKDWRDGELGWQGAVVGPLLALIPFAFANAWTTTTVAIGIQAIAAIGLIAFVASLLAKRPYRSHGDDGLGSSLLIGAGLCAFGFIMLALSRLLDVLPTMAAAGLQPPGWHTDFYWAKPSLILISVWAAVGSNNMLLFLAALSSVPTELYEAADLDGAKPRHRFWHVTWPQLAPTTFFIVVMSVIGGLQGGFEMARTLTRGGPDGATTTLSYFIYDEGFVTGRLGFSSAVAWTLFLLVMLVTAFNWKFGGRYAND